MHTKGKWSVDWGWDDGSSHEHWEVQNEDGSCIARLYNEDDAKHIVQMHNSFDELLEALRELVDIIEGFRDGNDYKFDYLTCQPAQTAIAEAEKE